MNGKTIPPTFIHGSIVTRASTKSNYSHNPPGYAFYPGMSFPLISQSHSFQSFLIMFRSWLFAGQIFTLTLQLPIYFGPHNMMAGIIILEVTWPTCRTVTIQEYTVIRNSTIVIGTKLTVN